MTKEIFIHYGQNRFDPDLWEAPRNRKHLSAFHKPIGGLWSSPVDSPRGWKDWCESEDFRTERLKESFKFRLNPEAKVYRIDCLRDLLVIPKKLRVRYSHDQCIDYEGMIALGYDAIWLTAKGERETRLSDIMTLCGWDVETLLVLNKDVIEVVD